MAVEVLGVSTCVATVHVHVHPCMYATQGHCVGDRLTI